MHVLLVPGLWLDASSWNDARAALDAAGHHVRALTMPGTGGSETETAHIGMDEWVEAVVAEIDAASAPVVLVGHSAGGNVVYAAADRRPALVAHVILLDTFPPAPGASIAEFPVLDGVVPFPGWDFFDDEDVADISPAVRDRVQGRTGAVPARVPTDPLHLHDERRHGIPLTIVSGTVPAAVIRSFASDPAPWAAELAAVQDLRVVALHAEGEPGGHWPQFSAPAATGQALAEAVAATPELR
ncbi:alpha/beta hydrolase [Microbacterium sp. SSW1-59]|uniref:alpha/beta fold hydrolase n=1 Tax=Microbacterium xanthum TaxID=3079794 RepID=UPI002AD2357C|nr:alpha/beta hydrolase [Microbacterium sp. SSW1-59]MDZ8202512.1 alpha/beta hydrolase [Microbacterium sp. SSW1-59]